MKFGTQQFFRGAGCAVGLFFELLPFLAPERLSTEKCVLEKISIYAIDPVHVSRVIQICDRLFGRDAPVATQLDIESFLFVLAKVKDMIGLFFFLLISQPSCYALEGESFEDVMLMLQLFSQLNAVKKIDAEVIGIATGFYEGSLTVRAAVEKLQAVIHRAEERAVDLFEKKCFSDDGLDDLERFRIDGIFTAIEWRRDAAEKKTKKDVVDELRVLKGLLGRGDFLLLLNPVSYQHVHSYTALYRVFHQIKIVAGMGGKIDELLQRLFCARISIVQLEVFLEKIKVEMSDMQSPEKELDDIAMQMDPLTKAQIGSVFHDYPQVYACGQELRFLRIDELISKVEHIQALARKRPLSSSESALLLAIAREAIRKEFGIYPYNTQVIAVLGLLHPSAEVRGRIAQVKTGEGKSTIIAMLAFYHAVLGQAVDIVSSSRYLSMRDEEKYQTFFSTYGIFTSHLCADVTSRVNFAGQIIFSTNFDLEWAVMRDYFEKQPMRTIERDWGVTSLLGRHGFLLGSSGRFLSKFFMKHSPSRVFFASKFLRK